MGFALAQAAAQLGAKTTLISGPVALETPDHVARVDVVSAADMLAASLAALDECDIFIGCAAVADYRPAAVEQHKIKKTADTMTVTLARNPDIIASVAAHDRRPFTVGFAAETNNVLDYARGKLERKNLDMIVANDVSNGDIGFNSEDNAVTLLWAAGERALEQANKHSIASNIMAQIAELYQGETAE
jgi:phosphopantothenoylcysteine decarboxylase/phosphopantothenate--cysteine ligase